MEYVAGQTLDKLIPPDGLATDLATKYAGQIGDPPSLTASSTAWFTMPPHRDARRVHAQETQCAADEKKE